MKVSTKPKQTPEQTPETIEERIKVVREMLGMSQREFSESIGINRSSYANLEKGLLTKLSTKTPIAHSVAEKYGISEEWIVSGTGRMKEHDIAKWAGDIMESDNAFAQQFLRLLRTFSTEQWKLLHDAISEN